MLLTESLLACNIRLTCLMISNAYNKLWSPGLTSERETFHRPTLVVSTSPRMQYTQQLQKRKLWYATISVYIVFIDQRLNNKIQRSVGMKCTFVSGNITQINDWQQINIIDYKLYNNTTKTYMVYYTKLSTDRWQFRVQRKHVYDFFNFNGTQTERSEYNNCRVRWPSG